jgi:hypothetical protein
MAFGLTAGSDYEEISAPKFSFSRSQSSAVRILRVFDFTKVNTLLLNCFPEPINSFPSGELSFPGTNMLYVENVDVEPFDDKLSSAEPPVCTNGARITLNYKSRPWNNSQNTGTSDMPGGGNPQSGGPGNNPQNVVLISWDIDIGGSFITQHNKSLHWASDFAKPGGELQFGTIEPTMDHTITWHHCPLPPWVAIRRCRGCVNSAIYIGASPGCLIFHGVQASREFSTQGEPTWTLKYKLSEKDNGINVINYNDPFSPNFRQHAGWNYYLRPAPDPKTSKAVQYDAIVVTDSLATLSDEHYQYRRQDFTNLFTPGAT